MNPHISPFQPVHSPIAIGVRDVLARIGFDPASLFDTGKVGWVYDLNDFSTMFQDAAGTIPAAVNQPVGLVLDKSKRLALIGTERVTNGDFSNGATGWLATGGATVSSSDGELIVTHTAPSNGVAQTIAGLTVGKFYKVVVTAKRGTGNIWNLLVGSSTGTAPIAFITPDKTNTEYETVTGYFLAAETSHRLYLRGGTASYPNTSIFKLVSVTQIAGNHKYQTTAASRSILRGTPIGANLFTGYGTPGAGWTDSGGGVATATASTASIPTNVAAVVGKRYRVRYTITRTAGSVTPSIGGKNLTARLASGTYEEYVDNVTNTNPLTFTGFSGFTGTVSAIDCRDASADAVTAPYGLQKDGVDDFELTAPVDLTGTNKVVVCIGVRKPTEQLNGTILEFSAGADANNGAFFLRASGGGLANYQWCVRSSTSYTTPVLNIAVPDTSMLTLIADLGAPQTTLRRNGVQGPQFAAPVGGGNFDNYPFYWGRRGGTSLPANVIEFSSIGYGGQPTNAELANMERWTTDRTPLAA